MSQQSTRVIKVFCGELCKSNICDSSTLNLLHQDINGITKNIVVAYAKFVKEPQDINKRVLDLLQIAAYVFCADRMVNRGSRDSVNNSSWARSFEFKIPVYDIKFWNDTKTKDALNDALQFMTGDRKYKFTFSQLKVNIITSGQKFLPIFNKEYISLDEAESTDIILFSGGLDSLAGAIQRLNEFPSRRLCLVTHIANKKVKHTQSILVTHLNKKYNNRVRPYEFMCHNHSLSSRDETQRTRMFLFSAIAFAICNCYGRHEIYVYENGITSMNLAKQGDVMNARASRTTHPKTLGLLKKFYRIFDDSFNFITPFHNKTKADAVEIFNTFNEGNIIPSSISCSSTRNSAEEPHCGCCSQCIDRRFAINASNCDEDKTIYASDFVIEIKNDETKQRLINTLRLASMDEIKTINDFMRKYPTEVHNLVEYWPGTNPDDQIDEIYSLIRAYGDSVLRAATKIRNKHDDISIPVSDKSLLGIINKRDYHKTPFEIRISELNEILLSAIPQLFQREKPKNENDFNDKIRAILSTKGKFSREYPSLAFSITTITPDHAQDSLLIESKYIRGKSMTPSKATEDIAADITKTPNEYSLMFVIYDPERKIVEDSSFIHSFESKRDNCFIRIYR